RLQGARQIAGLRSRHHNRPPRAGSRIEVHPTWAIAQEWRRGRPQHLIWNVRKDGRRDLERSDRVGLPSGLRFHRGNASVRLDLADEVANRLRRLAGTLEIAGTRLLGGDLVPRDVRKAIFVMERSAKLSDFPEEALSCL